MAIIVNNKFPVDNIARKAVGVNIPFNAPAVFQSNYVTRDAIKNNLINFFSTKKGERVFNPFFGSTVQNILFENIDPVSIETIRQIIKDELGRYFPFVSLKELTVNFEDTSNSLFIGITYVATNFGIEDQINLEL